MSYAEFIQRAFNSRYYADPLELAPYKKENDEVSPFKEQTTEKKEGNETD